MIEHLGEGGFGEVFFARPWSGSRELESSYVAIKRIFPEIARDEEALSILFEEASVAQTLRHPSICEVIELGHVGASHFIVMEYVSGRDLDQLQSHLFRTGRIMPIPAALFIVSEACGALEHAQPILHNGLIPQNIRMSYDGEVKVTDFGVGRAASFLLQGRTRILKRRYGYMPPEAIRGLPFDHRSELFSLGVILYELITGARAFRGENDLTTLDRVRRGDVIRPRTIRPEIPRKLEDVVMTAIASEPDDRFQLARDLRRALLRCLALESPSDTLRDLRGWMQSVFSNEHNAEILRLGTALTEHSLSSQLEDRSSSWPPPTI